MRFDYFDGPTGRLITKGAFPVYYDSQSPIISQLQTVIDEPSGTPSIRARIEDRSSTVEKTWVRYSTDGRNWSVIGMVPQNIHDLEFTPSGAGVVSGTYVARIDGLRPGQPFFYQVLAADQAGNAIRDSKLSFTLPR